MELKIKLDGDYINRNLTGEEQQELLLTLLSVTPTYYVEHAIKQYQESFGSTYDYFLRDMEIK